MFKRLSIFAYGLVAYAIFFATFLYALGFVGNFIVPRSIDGPVSGDLISSALIDIGLLLAFAVQHSVMARPAFKRWLTRFIPTAAERSTYVLASSVALIALFYFWQPLGGVVWNLENPVARNLVHAAFFFGWGLVLVSTFLINHFDLFGLRQIWLQLIGKPYTPLEFGTPGPYKLVRHPLYLGWFFAFWAAPTMTATHLLFALATTGYILVAIRLEERDLIDALGEDYRRYRERVPMIVPFSRAARGKRIASPMR